MAVLKLSKLKLWVSLVISGRARCRNEEEIKVWVEKVFFSVNLSIRPVEYKKFVRGFKE